VCTVNHPLMLLKRSELESSSNIVEDAPRAKYRGSVSEIDG
jgi:hypothetical protein